MVVLSDDLRGALGKVEGKGGLVGSKIVDVEDEFLRKELGGAPYTPSHTGIYLARPHQSPSYMIRDHVNTDQTVLVPRDIDRYDFLETKVPHEIWVDKRSDKSAARCIDMDGTVKFLLHEQVIDGLDIFVLPGVGRPKDCANAAIPIR